MPRRQKTPKIYLYSISAWGRLGGFYLKSFYSDPVSSYLRTCPQHWESMRYVWINYGQPEGSITFREALENLRGIGHFSEGPGWYSFVQTGEHGIASPMIFASIKCKGRREAKEVALSRARREYTVSKKEIDAMQARINLFGKAIMEEHNAA